MWIDLFKLAALKAGSKRERRQEKWKRENSGCDSGRNYSFPLIPGSSSGPRGNVARNRGGSRGAEGKIFETLSAVFTERAGNPPLQSLLFCLLPFLIAANHFCYLIFFVLMIPSIILVVSIVDASCFHPLWQSHGLNFQKEPKNKEKFPFALRLLDWDAIFSD